MSKETPFLPEELEQTSIEDLQEGESAYCVPWAIWVKLDKRSFINGHFSFESEEEGTLTMHIKRRGSEILVDKDSLGGHKFSRSEFPPHIDSKPEDYLPVKFTDKF